MAKGNKHEINHIDVYELLRRCLKKTGIVSAGMLSVEKKNMLEL